MSSEWNQVGFFAAGLAIGAAAAAMIVLGPYSPVRAKPEIRTAAPQTPPAAFRAPECPAAPIAAVAGTHDGRYRMPADLSGYAATDPQMFVSIGNEAAAAGRAHDAEIAYLMACRVADRFRGTAAAVAEARYELARYYGNLANASAATATDRSELLQRAEAMYSASLQIWHASPGGDPVKSRYAEQGLAGVRQMAAAQAVVAPGPLAAAPVVAAPMVAGPRSSAPARAQPLASAATAPPKPAAPKQVAAVHERGPSHCDGARTRADRLICSDAELARLDREVGYLQARARNAWRYEQEWRAHKAACEDRACLLRVLATRRSQLIADINSA